MVDSLERNELLEITKKFARKFEAKDIAVIEGDACHYIGKRPVKATKVNWPQEVR